MRATIFTAVVNKLKALTLFQGSDGTTRVYGWAKADPDGYPAASVTHSNSRSEILDTQRDLRTYIFNVRVAHERVGNDVQGHDEEVTERIMGEDEDTVLNAFDSDNDLGLANVIRAMPVNVEIGYVNNGTIRVMDITLEVQATVDITK